MDRGRVKATLGLVVVGLGLALPWSRIGGRDRSGFATADVFVGLGRTGLGTVVELAGTWWYAPAVLVLVAWAGAMLARPKPGARWAIVVALVAAGAMWVVFAAAGAGSGLLSVVWLGPLVVGIGLVLMLTSVVFAR